MHLTYDADELSDMNGESAGDTTAPVQVLLNIKLIMSRWMAVQRA